jgi:hypothetical protein
VSYQLVTVLRDYNLLNYLVLPECRHYREEGRIEDGEWKGGIKTKEKRIINSRQTTAQNKYWVHFLNVFLFLAGPEGLNKKT